MEILELVSQKCIVDLLLHDLRWLSKMDNPARFWNQGGQKINAVPVWLIVNQPVVPAVNPSAVHLHLRIMKIILSYQEKIFQRLYCRLRQNRYRQTTQFLSVQLTLVGSLRGYDCLLHICPVFYYVQS